MTKRFNGTVKWFNDSRGFGKILPDAEDAAEIWFHFRHLRMDGFKTVKEGARVSFELGENHKGHMAVKIDVEGIPSSESPKSQLLDS